MKININAMVCRNDSQSLKSDENFFDDLTDILFYSVKFTLYLKRENFQIN